MAKQMNTGMGSKSAYNGSKGQRDEVETVGPDYDLPLEKPTAKEVAASLRAENFVVTLKAIPEPTIDIFLDQLPAFKGKENWNFVFMIPRGIKFRYYCVPFKLVVPMLSWVKLSQEKRPRWQLYLVPKFHKLVGRNGPRMENVDLEPFYNKH